MTVVQGLLRVACIVIVVVVVAAAQSAARAEMVIDLAHPASVSGKEAVLFPFDRDSIPLRKGLEMTLLRSEATRASYNPVLSRGQRGSPDSFRIGYYGTVIE